MTASVNRNVERQAVRMHQMMQRLNIDAPRFGVLQFGNTYGESRARCLNCQSVGECLAWLDATPPKRETPGFCPNTSFFEACKPSAQSRTATANKSPRF